MVDRKIYLSVDQTAQPEKTVYIQSKYERSSRKETDRRNYCTVQYCSIVCAHIHLPTSSVRLRHSVTARSNSSAVTPSRTRCIITPSCSTSRLRLSSSKNSISLYGTDNRAWMRLKWVFLEPVMGLLE